MFLKIAIIIIICFFLPLLSFANFEFNGGAIVNGCSGALFIMNGMQDSQRALVITNGHCIRLKDLLGRSSNYPLPNERIYDLGNGNDPLPVAIILHSEQQSISVKTHRLLFATMTETDVAIFELSTTYAQLNTMYNVRPLLLDPTFTEENDDVSILSGYYKRTQSCSVRGFVNLQEGPYRTLHAIKLSQDCHIYTGFSGAPITHSKTRSILGLVNTHYDDKSDHAPCALNKPCEVDNDTGKKNIPAPGQSYGVSTAFLYLCYDQSKRILDFNIHSCHYKKPSAMKVFKVFLPPSDIENYPSKENDRALSLCHDHGRAQWNLMGKIADIHPPTDRCQRALVDAP